MFETIISKIEQYDSIVIFGHINPDGDCYGSQIALRNILRDKYPKKKIYSVGSGLKRFFDYLGKMDEVSDEIITHSLAILVDSNDIKRLEDKRAVNALDFAKIDHHIDTFSFHEGPEIIDTSATSTAELIYRFAKEQILPISKISASALYYGIMTDTARFQFADDFVKMFDIVKDLCALGADPIALNKVNNLMPESTLLIKSYIYQNVIKNDNGIIYVFASKNDRKRLGVTSQQIVSNTVLISYIENYPIWLIATETDNGGMQVEMRSNGINVQQIAASFGGGGHAYASGFTISEYKPELFDQLLDKCANAIKEGK